MRIDMTTRQWHSLIKPVIPHAGHDAGYPELAVIRLEATQRVLYAIATDKATLGVERMPIELGDPLQPIHIRVSDAKASLGLFPYDKHSRPAAETHHRQTARSGRPGRPQHHRRAPRHDDRI
jgi:hypothetical protein